MGSPYIPSPRGVHVAESYANGGDGDPYLRDSAHLPRRNRYSRSGHPTPRARDVAWVTSPESIPLTPHASATPWLPPPQMPSSPAYRPPSVIPPSPAPTVGEHMALDDVVITQDGIMDPYAYQPQRQGSGAGLFRSFWKGLRKLSRFPSVPPPFPRIGSYGSQTVGVPVPLLSGPSEATQYGVLTPPEVEEVHGPSPYASPYTRPPNLVTTPAVIPSPLQASPTPVPSIKIASPSIPPSPHPNSIRSVRMPSPVMATPHILPPPGAPDPVIPMPAVPPPEDGSQTLHEPFPEPVRPPFPSVVIPVTEEIKFPISRGAPGLDFRSTSRSSLSSPVARFRRFVAELDDLPWVSDNQIADRYIPERTERSLMRKRVRQGADPSWYNERPEVPERPEYWAEWDMWAKQSAAMLWNATDVEGPAVVPGQWGMMYPHGYAPMQPRFVYPPPGMMINRGHAPVIP